MNKISVYTDGSCLNNGKKNSVGSIGVYFSDNDSDNCGQLIDNEGNKITNQTMELIACIRALQIIIEKVSREDINISSLMVYIYTDSSYVINCMTKWYNGWIKNNWKNSKGKDVENKELIEQLFILKSRFITIFKHVRSHETEPSNKNSQEYKLWYGNYMADKLATDISKEYMRNLKEEDREIDDDTIKKKRVSKEKVRNSLNV